MGCSRRNFLTAAGAVAALAVTNPAKAFAGWIDGTKNLAIYPDPGIKVLDPSFAKYKMYNSGIERLATGFRWVEGPAWFGDGRYLLFSDIPNNRIMKWDEETGQISVFRQPSNYANGNTRDRQGRLVSCEHSTRRVTRTEYDGSITVIADNYQGKRLNSPNDIIVKSDGSIWFTDPPFGLNGVYEGGDRSAVSESSPKNVYRVDGTTLEVTVVADDVRGPNGLCFSPDESKCYIIESRAVPNRLILVYDVVDNGTKLVNKRTHIDSGKGSMPDGMRCDVDGNLWIGWGGSEEQNGVAVFGPGGNQIGHVSVPERVANLTFGGAKRNRLLMCGSQSIYSLFTDTQGATIS